MKTSAPRRRRPLATFSPRTEMSPKTPTPGDAGNKRLRHGAVSTVQAQESNGIATQGGGRCRKGGGGSGRRCRQKLGRYMSNCNATTKRSCSTRSVAAAVITEWGVGANASSREGVRRRAVGGVLVGCKPRAAWCVPAGRTWYAAVDGCEDMSQLLCGEAA